MLRSIIFDMDGVLVDSEPLHIRAERETLAPFEIEVTDEELQSYMGQTPQILLGGLIEKYCLDTTLDEIYPDHKMNLLRLYKEEVEPIPGALNLINHLKKEKMDLALASSSSMELISSVLDKFDLQSLFRVIVSGEEVQRPKPYPDIFWEATRLLGCEPYECVVIEDSTAGVKAAKSAGIKCVGFRSPNSENQDLNKADLIIDDLQEIDYEKLVKLVDRNYESLKD